MTAAARTAFEEAVAFEDSGELDKALASFLKAQELSPQDTEIAYRTAAALLQSGCLEEALSQLRRIVFAEPDHLAARTSLGNCQLLLGDISNAGQNFSEVLAQEADNRNALYGLASVLLKEGKPLEAAQYAQRLINLMPASSTVLTLVAETLARSNRNSQAIAAYRKALKIDAHHLPALLGLAEMLLLRKQFGDVIDLMITAAETSSADPRPYELLSDALAGTGALEDALEAAETALRFSPNSSDVLVRLSTLSRKLDDYPSALCYALKAHDHDNQAKSPLNALGAALASLKFAKEARAVLTASVSNGLPAEIRTVIERTIAEAQDQITGSMPSGNTDATPDSASNEFAERTETPSVKTDTKKHMPASEVSSFDDWTTNIDALPNVLGLHRRDRS